MAVSERQAELAGFDSVDLIRELARRGFVTADRKVERIGADTLEVSVHYSTGWLVEDEIYAGGEG